MALLHSLTFSNSVIRFLSQASSVFPNCRHQLPVCVCVCERAGRSAADGEMPTETEQKKDDSDKGRAGECCVLSAAKVAVCR